MHRDFVVSENYLDPEVAYLLGLITMRGQMIEAGGDRRVLITFPFRSLKVEGFDQPVHLEISVNQIRDRLQELVETPVMVHRDRSSVVFIIRFLQRSVAWRNLQYLFQSGTSYLDVEVPQSIMDAPSEIQKEFLRGVADAGGFIRRSNADQNKCHRVYLEVNNRNWRVPVQICHILQKGLGIPVQTIQWGHPNVREPKGRGNWAREHQVKVLADLFEVVGFYVGYKGEILKIFAEENRVNAKCLGPHPCNPHPQRRVTTKPPHTAENSPNLPEHLRGKHFDACWQICLEMGCQQRDMHGQMQLDIPESEDEDNAG